ncbi:putative MFS-type transporter [Pseudomonas chlororaphis subsp. aureofaciens]|nr:putative MFS-type transporter [Pseudomonas chlororaphis subsp. aureofaciens]
MPISRLPSNHTAAPSLSIVGVAIASACYALVSLVCMLLLLKRIGHNAADLSTAEQADADELAREPRATPLIEDPATLPPNIDKDAQPAH